MAKSKSAWKIVLIVFLVLVVPCGAIAGIWYWKKSKDEKDGGSASSSNGSSSSLSASNGGYKYTTNAKFPLVNGSKGRNVERLQKALNKDLDGNLAVDGIVGPKTIEAANKVSDQLLKVESICNDYIVNMGC